MATSADVAMVAIRRLTGTFPAAGVATDGRAGVGWSAVGASVSASAAAAAGAGGPADGATCGQAAGAAGCR